RRLCTSRAFTNWAMRWVCSTRQSSTTSCITLDTAAISWITSCAIAASCNRAKIFRNIPVCHRVTSRRFVKCIRKHRKGAGESRRMIDDLWYKNAIIYSLNVGTFMDSNGDGVGDFEGLSRRLDYLAGTGVTCLWLQPFQPSPDRDAGYDVSDFYGVDPRHGSSGDFVDLTHQAAQRGIRVIVDLVVNHTSDRHPWFKSARADPDSKYRDWYVWSKKKPKDYNQGMVFPGIQRATWSYDKVAREWYYHRFYKFQPDLNVENPAVK